MSTRYPENIQELVNFYYDEFKPIYSSIQQTNRVPAEMFFEINAAFDHWTRIIKYGENEAKAINAVCAHLKRGCFDAFKITVLETRKQYDELRRIDYSVLSLIESGRFIHDMIALWETINALGREARLSEGDSRDEERWHIAFDKWKIVIAKCEEFTTKFYLNKDIDWAKIQISEREKNEGRKRRMEGIAIGVIGSLLASAIWYFAIQS
jgi:hypothetical protein